MDALAQYDFQLPSFGTREGHFNPQQPPYTPLLENLQPLESNTSTGYTNNSNSKSRPCDACRRRKSRCVLKDGALKCVLCDFHNQACTYLQTPQARKRKSVSISQDEEVIVSSKRSPVRESIRRSITQTGASPPKTDQTVDDYANLKGPSLLKRTLGLQRRRHGIYQGPSGSFEAALIGNEEPVSRVSSHGDVQFLQASNYDRFLLLPDEATDHYDNEVIDIDAIEAIVAPHGQTLINLYFRIVHPSFPILHKKVFLEKYSRTHQEFSPPLLAAVYILALQYWSYENELLRFKKPEVGNLEELAMRSLAYVVHRPKLSTVEAGLLLLQWRTGSSSWALTSQMVAVGQELGLHLDCSSWNIPGWERGLRKRLAWALFMQDKWSSFIHGRPSHINNDADWAVQPLTERDFPENATDDDDREGSTEVEKGRSIFSHMVLLTQILANVLTTLYSGRVESEIRAATGADATKLVLSKAKPLQMRLNAWHASLPEYLSMENVTIRKLSSTGYLHLAYWATEISLHRCIFRTLPNCNEAELTHICRKAAETRLTHAVAFVKALKAEHLQSFWYFASAFNFGLVGIFQSLLCIFADTRDEKETHLKILDEYRWLLRVSSKSAVFLEQAMAMIDLYAGGVRTLALDTGGSEEVDRSKKGKSGGKDGQKVDWDQESLPAGDEGVDLERRSEDDASVSLRTDDTSLAWYAQTPVPEEADTTMSMWEGLDITS